MNVRRQKAILGASLLSLQSHSLSIRPMGLACINCGLATLSTIVRPWEFLRHYESEGFET